MMSILTHFFIEGQQIIEEERQVRETWTSLQREQLGEDEMEYDDEENIQLLEGKIKQERLKKAIMAYLYAEGINEGGGE
jgi:hypothetical protein